MPRAKGGLTEKRGHLLRTQVSWGLRELFSNKINPGQGVGGGGEVLLRHLGGFSSF